MQIIPINDVPSQQLNVSLANQACTINLYTKSVPVNLYPQDVLSVIQSGTAQAGASNSLTLSNTASSVTDFYKGLAVRITDGTGAGQQRNVVTSRINLNPYSQDLTNARYTKTAVSISGASGWQKMVDDGTINNHGVLDAALVLTGNVSISAKVRAAEYAYAYLWLDDGSGHGNTLEVNLTTGVSRFTRQDTVHYSNISSYVVPLSETGGGYRIGISATTSYSFVEASVYMSPTPWVSGNFGTPNNFGNLGSGIYVGGIQIETGLSVSEYIHTEANAAVGVAVDQAWSTIPDTTSKYELDVLSKNQSAQNPSTQIFCDLYVNNTLIIGGVVCQNLNRIVRDLYLGFIGDLIFQDTQGTSDPFSPGLGTRFQFCYLEVADLGGLG